jgi:proline iminopeptidase
MKVLKGLAILIIALLSGCANIGEIGVLVPPTVDQDPNLPSVAVNVAGKKRLIHIRTFGNPNNPPLFILHGSFTDTRPYQNICQGLSDKYYVVIWDQRGCGLSERITEEEFTLETAVEEINAIKNIYAPHQKITLIGQSWGGGLATLYTSKNPKKVRQLLLIEPMPLAGKDMEKLFNTIVQFRYEDGTWNSLARQGQAISPKAHEQIDYRAMMILRSAMTASYHCDGNNPPNWPIHRVGGFLEYVRNKRLGNPISGFAYDFTEGIQNYPDTVMILGGSCSSLGYRMQLQYAKPYFRFAQVVEIKDAGHRMNMEKFEEVMAAIQSFLKEY